MPNMKDNPCNRPNFDAAIAMLKFLNPKVDFHIRDIWMDYGAGMMWETIIAGKGSHEYQVLCPRDWDLIQNALDLPDVVKVVLAIQKDQAKTLERF